MLTYTVLKQDRVLSGEITLAPTKSINSRSINIRALKNSKFDIKSIPEKDAARLIDISLREGQIPLDKGDPAKAIRFLRAFLAFFRGEWIITGSAEMKQHPVGDVIDLLHKQGLNIKYLEREGFPPLKIIGKGIKGSIIRVDASICSHFVSSSFHISPTLSVDEVVELRNWIINSPHINQTIRLLKYLGVNSDWSQAETLFEYELKIGGEMSIEADWLSASYWYQAAALSKKAEFRINGINPNSVQSDAIVKEIFEPLGVKTIETGSGVILTRTERKLKTFKYDFTHNPDLVPTLVATCVALNMPFTFSGIEVMNHKDPQRLMALQSQMSRLGARITLDKKGVFETINFMGDAKIPKQGVLEFATFADHRIAMSLAPLAIIGIGVTIEDPRVVSKSYPCYWDDFKKTGFNLVHS